MKYAGLELPINRNARYVIGKHVRTLVLEPQCDDRTGKIWNEEELKYLKEGVIQGEELESVCNTLCRNPSSVLVRVNLLLLMKRSSKEIKEGIAAKVKADKKAKPKPSLHTKVHEEEPRREETKEKEVDTHKDTPKEREKAEEEYTKKLQEFKEEFIDDTDPDPKMSLTTKVLIVLLGITASAVLAVLVDRLQ